MIMETRDREPMWLEKVLLARRILLLEQNRFVSHMTKSCILKVLTVKQDVFWNLAEVVEEPFQTPKFIFKSPQLISLKLLLNRYLWKNQNWSNRFLTETTLLDFTISDYTTKKYANTHKQVSNLCHMKKQERNRKLPKLSFAWSDGVRCLIYIYWSLKTLYYLLI